MHWNIEPATDFDGLAIDVIGSFNLADHAELVEAVLNHPQWSPGTATLWNFEHCSFEHVTGNQMAHAAYYHRAHDEAIGDGPSALVMPSLIQYADGRAHQNRLAGRVQSTIGVFRDYQQAVDWINQQTAYPFPDD